VTNKCKKCGAREEIVFHHWFYNSSIFGPEGCYLCKECHNWLHDDGSDTPSENTSWRFDCLKRLINFELDKGELEKDYIVNETFRKYSFPHISDLKTELRFEFKDNGGDNK